MKQRYQRAVKLTAPKITAVTAGVAVDGYWINDRQFYFAADHFEPELGRFVSVPSIADNETQRVTPVLPMDELARLLSEHTGRAVDSAALAQASFDMPAQTTLAVSLGGQDHLIHMGTRRVIQTRPSLSVPALYSPDGRLACFIKGDDLWLRELASGQERPLTTGGQPNCSYGRQTDTGLAAVSYRKHPSPMGLWSPDSQWLLTHRIDERTLPDLPLVHNVPPENGRPVLHHYKYCVPGDPLPVASFVAIHLATGRVHNFDDFPVEVMTSSPFSTRTIWFSGPDQAFVLRVDRYFKRAELIELDLATGKGRIVLTETTQEGYLEFHQLLAMTPNVRTLRSGEIIWYSERDGRAHLYLYDAATGVQKDRITDGDWIVRDIIHVDEAQRRILFTACGIDPQVDPVRRTLCSVNFDGSGFEILLKYTGDMALPRTEPCGLDQSRPFSPSYAQPGVSADNRFGVVRFTHVDSGNETRIVDLRTQRSFTLASALPGPDDVRSLTFTALAADGVTKLYGTLFLPPNFDERQQYPLVDYIYPGPQTNVHPQSFRSVSSAQATVFAALGMVSLMLDTRGMPFRDKAVRQASYADLGQVPIADHVAVVRQLCERYSFIDRERIGILGQSGGGYAAARAIFEHGDLFKVAVSVCGNHDSNLYSALWSDKYRGPNVRGEFSQQASAATAHKLTGKLLLVSGDMDENVHVSQTLTVVDALVRANRDFELLIVPNEGHLILMRNGYVQRRIWDFFVRQLLHETPPQDFAIEYASHEIQRMEKSWIWEWRT